MEYRTKSAVAGLAVAAMIAGGSLAIAPTAKSEPRFDNAQVHQVANRNWNGGRNWNNNWRSDRNRWVGPAVGFGAGVLLGSVLTQPRYGYAPPVGRGPVYVNRDAYCANKYNSYNPYTGMYFGYDGRFHYCRIP